MRLALSYHPSCLHTLSIKSLAVAYRLKRYKMERERLIVPKVSIHVGENRVVAGHWLFLCKLDLYLVTFTIQVL